MSLTYEQLQTRMEETPLKDRNIGHFCGFAVYGKDGCTQENCDRMHTCNLDFMREYLEDDKIKSVLCENDGHCTHFLCRFGHEFDHVILGHTHPDNKDEIIFTCNEEARNKARDDWAKVKQDAFNSELLDGSRKPKNKRERDLLARLRKRTVAKTPSNFPTLAGNVLASAASDAKPAMAGSFPMNANFGNYMALDCNARFNRLSYMFTHNPSSCGDPQIIAQIWELVCLQNQVINN